MIRKTIQSTSVVVSLFSTLALGGCAAADDGARASDEQNLTDVQDASKVTEVFNTSDFNNVWTVKGRTVFFEGDSTLVLMNASQPNKPLIKTPIRGATGIGFADFEASVVLGSPTTDESSMPALGDCIAVKNDPGAEVVTDEQLRARPEFGAFVYISDPLSGAPRRPAWGVGAGGRPKVYATVKQCLNDVDRSWSNASPNDKLENAADASDFGARFHLQGKIGGFEGMADIALVNVSDVTEPIVLETSFESGGGIVGIGTMNVNVEIPEEIKPGTCLAIKNVSGGRGFTTDETRAKEEFGAFLYAFSGGDGQMHPAGSTGPKVFRTSEECLKDPSALTHQ